MGTGSRGGGSPVQQELEGARGPPAEALSCSYSGSWPQSCPGSGGSNQADRRSAFIPNSGRGHGGGRE